MWIFLDANILFSAAKSDGAVRRLLDLLIEAGHECWADGFVAEEARRNLAAKFPDGLPVLDTLLARLRTGPIHAPDPALEGAPPRSAIAAKPWSPAIARISAASTAKRFTA